ncbi:MAG: TerC family protein [Chloroflexota bacterium]|nr:TerC family protein [Chloroflexota bacterium]MDQ5864888.1 TerC family protein [Chloroflexota bacterium]
MEWLLNPDSLIALATLTLLEIVLGIDNIIFISILAGRLPKEQQATARTIGLGLAMFTRVLLLLSLSWIISLTAPLFEVLGQEISGRDLILIGGGLFLLGKSTWEIHHRLEGEPEGHGEQAATKGRAMFVSTLVQIILLDIVFSLDSVITAVGMANELWVMITAVVIAVGIMMISAGAIGRFIEQHPTIKVLALSFLLLIGVTLVAEGFDQHISKGYIYFAMAFSVFVEMINIRVRSKSSKAVELHQPYMQH